jgi:hypothetical protein
MFIGSGMVDQMGPVVLKNPFHPVFVADIGDNNMGYLVEIQEGVPELQRQVMQRGFSLVKEYYFTYRQV